MEDGQHGHLGPIIAHVVNKKYPSVVYIKGREVVIIHHHSMEENFAMVVM